MSKILIYDIETTDLNSDWGRLVCVGYKWLGDKNPTVISILDYPGKDVLDDSNLVKAFHDILPEADMVVTFFGKGFDQPWMTGKYLESRLSTVPNTPHVDLFYVAKSKLRISRKSLDNITSYLNLGKKYNVSKRNWMLAKVGVEEGIKEVIKHCYADVNLTEKLYLLLRSEIRQHPRIAGWLPCRSCGSTKLQRRGYALTIQKGKRIRVQCTKCGAWETRSEQHTEDAMAV